MWFIGWPLGLLLSAISSVFGITGKLLLKLAHNERDREEELMNQPNTKSQLKFQLN